jgi:outer membrane lipoprotein-sorting protein
MNISQNSSWLCIQKRGPILAFFLYLCAQANPILSGPAHASGNKAGKNAHQKRALGKAYSPVKKSIALSLTPDQWLHKLSSALESIRTLSADMVQKNPNGASMTAKFYLERPGRMRLVYNPPSKMQIIATKGRLIHYDGQRDHSQSMALSSSPVAFLLTGKLHEQVQLTEFMQNNQIVTLGMKLKKDPNAGKIHLTFNAAMLPNARLCPLTGWSMTDAYGKKTVITLFNILKNGIIPKGAFDLQKR